MRTRALFLVVCLAAACGDERDAPRLVLQRADPYGVKLLWTHPSGEAAGGYVLEMSVAGAPFAWAAATDPGWLGTTYVFGDDAPEQTVYAFRVRALPDPDLARASNAVTIRRGVLTPLLACDARSLYGCTPEGGTAFHLRWHRPAASADLYRLDRRIRDQLDRPQTGWVAVMAPATATDFLDFDLSLWANGRRYEYRLVATGAGGEEGDPSYAFTAEAPP